MATMQYQIDDYKQTFRLSNLPAGSFYKDEKNEYVLFKVNDDISLAFTYDIHSVHNVIEKVNKIGIKHVSFQNNINYGEPKTKFIDIKENEFFLINNKIYMKYSCRDNNAICLAVIQNTSIKSPYEVPNVLVEETFYDKTTVIPIDPEFHFVKLWR